MQPRAGNYLAQLEAFREKQKREALKLKIELAKDIEKRDSAAAQAKPELSQNLEKKNK